MTLDYANDGFFLIMGNAGIYNISRIFGVLYYDYIVILIEHPNPIQIIRAPRLYQSLRL